MTPPRQRWLHSAAVDGWVILAPPFLASAFALMAAGAGFRTQLSPWMWVVLILGVDVAHVYATLFRTYLDAEELARRRALYVLVPLGAWMVGALLYSLGPLVFWRTLAYLAVFHFIRQQYGFVRIYGRLHGEYHRDRLAALTIYSTTIYPLIFWHSHLPRDFEWFVRGDFISLPTWTEPPARFFYIAVLITYGAREWTRRSDFNWPKNLVIGGTAVSWLIGIVLLNGDLTFTTTNVLAHGVPYLGLVWLQTQLHIDHHTGRRALGAWSWLFRTSAIPLFLGLLVALAYLEEGLWDALVWREHVALFAPFRLLPAIESSALLTIVVPVLAVPQATHYILDGFIWRLRNRGASGGILGHPTAAIIRREPARSRSAAAA